MSWSVGGSAGGPANSMSCPVGGPANFSSAGGPANPMSCPVGGPANYSSAGGPANPTDVALRFRRLPMRVRDRPLLKRKTPRRT
ncbi:hypothetical protein CgunFtcFv8_026542 [Champsocephalus gunnari]|uniref:Uncharacterized protein n=1 Tax=Champsocephalus gunnari TaxID=52237 RepID=A0AAN8I0K0_CHAGU|nr:hypothetical protein CgunFtcFv8_026542 [Champsocephalus gunnari]